MLQARLPVASAPVANRLPAAQSLTSSARVCPGCSTISVRSQLQYQKTLKTAWQPRIPMLFTLFALSALPSWRQLQGGRKVASDKDTATYTGDVFFVGIIPETVICILQPRLRQTRPLVSVQAAPVARATASAKAAAAAVAAGPEAVAISKWQKGSAHKVTLQGPPIISVPRPEGWCMMPRMHQSLLEPHDVLSRRMLLIGIYAAGL